MSNIHWYCGTIVHLDGTITHLTEKDLNMEAKIPLSSTRNVTVRLHADVVFNKTPAGNEIDYDYEVKSWPWFFEPMCSGKKKHDMRDMRDRTYKIGDRMLLREWDPRNGQYTGREAIALITYITSNEAPCAMSSTALDRNTCILSLHVSELGDTDRNA